MIISEIKVRLKELNTQHNVKWPVSGTKAELIDCLGWAEQPQASDIFTDNSNQAQAWFQDMIQYGLVVKRIPKASRIPAGKGFTEVLKSVTTENNKDAWEKFVRFPRSCFQKPKRAGTKKLNLPSNINKRLESFKNNSLVVSKPPTPKNSLDPDLVLKKAVTAKIQMFDIKGAVRIASSNDVILKPSPEVKKRLQEKQPAPKHSPEDIPDPKDVTDCIVCTKEDVRKGIQSFPNGSGAGIMGLYPQHLKDLTSKQMGIVGENLIEAIRDFLNEIVFKGKVPEEALQLFYGATLMALSKIDGGVRPIAIGLTIRRLATKIIMAKLQSFCETTFHPTQLGVCTARGCEIAVHTLRKWIESPSVQDKVLIKIDFANAFNSIRRDVVLQRVKSHTPQIYKFIHQCYAQQTHLSFGDEGVILSQEGVQQGDPCGPFLFSLAILDLSKQMVSPGNIWYLDDSTLAGDAKSVIADFQKIKAASETLGLDINNKKCELMVIDQQSPENTTLLQNFCENNPAIRVIGNKDLTLLGAPVSPEAIEEVLNSKLESLKLMTKRLELLDSHEAMYLLKNCFALPKLNYFLRSSPCFLKKDILQEYDSVIKESLVSILNLKLDGQSGTQYSLPVRLGGLGIRSAVDISIPAYLSSVHGSVNGVNSLMPTLDPFQVNFHYESAKQEWCDLVGPHVAFPIDQSSQASWDLPLCQMKYNDFLIKQGEGQTAGGCFSSLR